MRRLKNRSWTDIVSRSSYNSDAEMCSLYLNSVRKKAKGLHRRFLDFAYDRHCYICDANLYRKGHSKRNEKWADATERELWFLSRELGVPVK